MGVAKSAMATSSSLRDGQRTTAMFMLLVSSDDSGLQKEVKKGKYPCAAARLFTESGSPLHELSQAFLSMVKEKQYNYGLKKRKRKRKKVKAVQEKDALM